MFSWLFKSKCDTETTTELRRIRHILEAMQRDATSRGVLQNEIKTAIEGKHHDDKSI
jgi:hypothetical protein